MIKLEQMAKSNSTRNSVDEFDSVIQITILNNTSNSE